MKWTDAIGTIAILAGLLIFPRCHHPTPAAAAVEIIPGAVTNADRAIVKELVVAFDQAEAAVQKADLEALMPFYANTYNYHGLKPSDVRRVWDEVFAHYREISSRHIFTELKLVQAGGVKKAYVTCTGGLYGMEKKTGKPIMIDSWVSEVHHLVKEGGKWHFLGNAPGVAETGPAGSAPHHPLF